MFGSRELKQYKDTEVPGPEPCVIHKTFLPVTETEERVRFDVRSIGRAAHMSSTVSLIRTVKGYVAAPSEVAERFTLKAGLHERKFYGVSTSNLNGALRMPGFALQENLERVNFRFNAGDCVTGTKWLAPYAKLYRKSMTPFVRNSGGSISNQNDQIHRSGWYMTHDAYIEVSGATVQVQGVTYNVNTAGKKYLTGTITYCNPERNDRHVPSTSIPNPVNIHNGTAKVYWYGQPHDILPTIMEGPDDLDDPIRRIGLFRPAVANDHINAPPNFNYGHTIGNTTFIFDSGYSLVSDEFQNFYVAYWKHIDDVQFEDFDTLRKELYLNGVLEFDNQSNHQKWEAMKVKYRAIFQTFEQAQNAATGDDSANWEDTLHNWGVDLRKPFYDYQPTDPNANSGQAFYLKTATHMLQFADEIQRWRAMHMEHTDEINVLRTLSARMEVLTDSIENDDHGTPGIIFSADLVLDRMEAEEDEKTAAYIEAEAEYTELVYFLKHYELPYERVDVAGSSGSDSDDVLSLTEQVGLMINDKQAEIDAALQAFRDQFRMFHHWEETTNRDWMFSLQIMSRLWSWMNTDVNKNAKTSNTFDRLLAIEHTFVEPVMCGPCKPSEYSSVGCYAGNSNILPHIERFELDLQYRKDAKYFELDWYKSSYTDTWTGEIFYPTINVTDWSSRLHCTFVEKPVPLPATVPYIDVRTETLSILELQNGIPQVIEFQDIEIRRKFKYLMVYCRRVSEVKWVGTKENIDSDKSASISQIQLSTDAQQRCLEADETYMIDALTRRNFPEYEAPIHRTGNIFAICYNELPQRKDVSGVNHLNGKVTIIQDWIHEVEVEVCMSFFQTDTMFEITEHHARKQMNLSAV